MIIRWGRQEGDAGQAVTGVIRWVAKVSRAGGDRRGRGAVQRASNRVRLWSETGSKTGERRRETDNRMLQTLPEPVRARGFVRPTQAVIETLCERERVFVGKKCV